MMIIIINWQHAGRLKKWKNEEKTQIYQTHIHKQKHTTFTSLPIIIIIFFGGGMLNLTISPMIESNWIMVIIFCHHYSFFLSLFFIFGWLHFGIEKKYYSKIHSSNDSVFVSQRRRKGPRFFLSFILFKITMKKNGNSFIRFFGSVRLFACLVWLVDCGYESRSIDNRKKLVFFSPFHFPIREY